MQFLQKYSRSIIKYQLLFIFAICIFILLNVKTSAESLPTSTVSGTIKSEDGTPLRYVYVVLTPTNPLSWACTDANGYYSITAPSTTVYRMEMYASSSAGNPNCPNYNPAINSNAPTDFMIRSQSLHTEVDLPSGNVVKNFSFPTAKLTVTARDAEGNLVTGPRQAFTYPVKIYESALYSNGDSTLQLGTVKLPAQSLDTTGQLSGYVIKGTVFPVGSICVNALTLPEYCNQSAITVNDDTEITIAPFVAPNPPVALRAQSPATAASLTWDDVPEAASYNIYRNNNKIGSTTSTSFSDSSAPEGNNSYSVTAMNILESAHSNLVTVIVDRTLPEISYSLSLNPNTNGWNNSNVMVTFSCTDAYSGVKSCTNPITLTNEGANLAVAGMAADNAGNETITTTSAIKIDKTPPLITNPTMSSKSVVAPANMTLSAKVSDSLSGVTKGEFYIDKDPGQGKGTAMTYSNGKVSTTTTIKNLGAGLLAQHKLYMRTMDAAGNWSSPAVTTFTYTDVSPILVLLLAVLFALF